jgi:cation diffusion facilitator CzcD-associated flavoprotein CzcO
MARERSRLCIIVGAGVSGLVQAAELLRKDILQPEELEILDRSNDYGGVWNTATYPGSGCDVFSILYQVSWFRKPGKITLPSVRNESYPSPTNTPPRRLE